MNRVFLAALAGVVLAGGVLAEVPASSGFTFKRVKPPAPDTKKRITVQVPPRDNPAVIAPPSDLPQPESTVAVAPNPLSGIGSYAWYWELISPSLIDSAPGRLQEAVTALAAGPEGTGVSKPRLAQMQSLAETYGTDLLIATVGTSVSPALALAVASVESGGNAEALSPKGAHGVMQLIPATAERFGVEDSADPAQNIAGGVKYLDWLMQEFDGDPILVLAAYNAGEGAVKKNDGVPPYAETRDYVPKVLAAWTVAQGLCMTPPQLVSDGCVFRTSGSQ
ncbi:lytic murein transglycosylase [Actibacterium mucosum KCTC 23349]|uniref:Lytic murein transglycosylase n=1 Tax=Actibacterium mucosum KCTC 23349 TaxID=1454373 RepID=A0A037ZD46_9RHOB|nr:lytic transglycosylase domain-containing protein [Actibacterium mucosum]KAJ54077.1 lytic murein transglycosylase [Actibacterium mucosum KCTC 23349]